MIPENRLEVSDPRATETVKRPIEKQVLEAFETPRRISTTLEALENCSACRGYADNLERSGLLHTQESRDAFQHHRWIAIAVLLSVAVLKIFIALSRGRSNILFLILLTILACFLTTLVGNPFPDRSRGQVSGRCEVKSSPISAFVLRRSAARQRASRRALPLYPDPGSLALSPPAIVASPIEYPLRATFTPPHQHCSRSWP